MKSANVPFGDLIELFDGSPPDPLSRTAMARLAERPGFRSAVDLSARRILGSYRERRAANRLLNDRGRLVLSILLLDLHYRAAAGECEATLARLQELCARHGVCSRGRTAAMIAAMRLFGLVAVEPSPDRRARRLVPTEGFERMTRERWEALLDGVSRLLPSIAPVARRIGEQPVAAAFVRGMCQRFFEGYRAVAAVPEIAPYIERDGGLMVLFSLHLAGNEDGLSGDGFTIAGTARRFQLSRAHVASVVKIAVADGLVVRSGPRDGLIRPTPRLAAIVDAFFASAFLMHAVATHDAAALLGLVFPPDPEASNGAAAGCPGRFTSR